MSTTIETITIGNNVYRLSDTQALEAIEALSTTPVDYTKIINKPSINGKELVGNITIKEGIQYTAGTGISITDGVISCTVTPGNDTPAYQAGNGITLNDSTISVDTSVIATKSELFSKSYQDLTNKPTIPTKTSQLTNDSGFITDAPVTSVNGLTGDIDISNIIMPGTAISIATSGTQRVISIEFENSDGFMSTGLTGGLALNFDVVARKSYVDEKIGDISTVIDELNGEVL